MNSAMEDAHKQQKQALEEYQKALDQIFEEHKQATLKKAEMELKYKYKN